MTKDYFCEKCFFFKTSLDFSAKMYPWHLLKRESKLRTTQQRERSARLLPPPDRDRPACEGEPLPAHSNQTDQGRPAVALRGCCFFG